MKYIHLIFAVMLLTANTSCAASYDCAKAGTKVEKMICADAELSKLDDNLSAAYSKALKESSDPSTLKQQQRGWMKERNKCVNSECVKTKCQDRIASLAKTVPDEKTASEVSKSSKQNKTLVFKLEGGNDRAVCHDMAENMNRVQPSLASFSTEVVFDPKMTQFSWPEWKELDIKDYLDVVYTIENKLMHIYPSEAQSFDDWKKTYLANMKAGASGKGSRLGQTRMVWRPRLRIARVRFEADGPLETVLGYSRNRDAGEWKKGWYAECPSNYSNPEATRQTLECGKHYIERLGIEGTEGQPGDYIVLYEPEKRKVDFILSGDRGAGASSLLAFFLFLHNGTGYMSGADTVAMSISRLERIKSLRPTVPSWMHGRYICGFLYPRSRNQ